MPCLMMNGQLRMQKTPSLTSIPEEDQIIPDPDMQSRDRGGLSDNPQSRSENNSQHSHIVKNLDITGNGTQSDKKANLVAVPVKRLLASEGNRVRTYFPQENGLGCECTEEGGHRYWDELSSAGRVTLVDEVFEDGIGAAATENIYKNSGKVTEENDVQLTGDVVNSPVSSDQDNGGQNACSGLQNQAVIDGSVPSDCNERVESSDGYCTRCGACGESGHEKCSSFCALPQKCVHLPQSNSESLEQSISSKPQSTNTGSDSDIHSDHKIISSQQDTELHNGEYRELSVQHGQPEIDQVVPERYKNCTLQRTSMKKSCDSQICPSAGDQCSDVQSHKPSSNSSKQASPQPQDRVIVKDEVESGLVKNGLRFRVCHSKELKEKRSHFTR